VIENIATQYPKSLIDCEELPSESAVEKDKFKIDWMSGADVLIETL